MAKKFRLQQPGLADEVGRRLEQRCGVRQQQRLLALKLALSGELTLEQIGRAVGRARSTVAGWMALVREGQLEPMLQAHQGRGRAPSLKAKAIKELRQGLLRGRWTRAKDAQAWLEQRHKVRMGLKGVRYWLKKHRGVMRVPRRFHTRKNPAAAEAFKRTLARQLWELKVPRTRPVRVWIMDEHRHGLISHGRRCWTLRGVRPRARYRTCYQWGYVATALEIEGRAQALCLFFDGVSLEQGAAYLEQLAQSDRDSTHVVIADQAGFHLRDGDPRVPANVRLLMLPPYSPELNPVERVGDLIKDATANRVFPTLALQEAALENELRPLWEDPARVRSLIGQGWLRSHVNIISPCNSPVFN